LGTVVSVVDRFEIARHRMVDEQLVARDITDARVLAAMRRVPRHEFVDGASAAEAYGDSPLPIGHGATISQPYIVAFMAQAVRLAPTDRVLDVGTGSGYAAAVLAELAAHVTTIECIEPLARRSAALLADRAEHIEVVHGDGSMGYPPGAPYEAITVAAAGPDVPTALLDQLAPGGRLVMPVGRRGQDLVRVTRTPGGDVTETLLAVRFVPLTGRFGV
jgi:protein-L-isoaspartate(D-aspartate) O-methyltransferase